MKPDKKSPHRRPIEPRPLNSIERGWIQAIVEKNPLWADVDLSRLRVVADCGCGYANCKTVYLDENVPVQNPRLAGTKGYIGRIEISTQDDFGITVTLDQGDGKLSELYVLFTDIGIGDERTAPQTWQELFRTVTSM
jgi:hypothetical protein